MAPQTINFLLSSFPGLPLPPTLSFALPSTAIIADVADNISSRLPPSLRNVSDRLLLTTTSNRQLLPYSSESIATLLDGAQTISQSTFIPLRLSARLCGGKGGFGSQLRAAGGRMSSRRKGNQEENNGSNRNLDGRRLRTVKEAKALAEYLALKPDMDKKAKEARRKRWEAVVEAAERREAEIRNGEGKGKVDGVWMEDKEEVGEKAREAVLRAMKEGNWKDNLAGAEFLDGSSASASASASNSSEDSRSSASPSDGSDMEDVAETSTSATTLPQPAKSTVPARRYFGFDDEDDDELMSDEEDEEGEADIPDGKELEGKGKGKA
ncbi:uncharacterized protein BDCG_08393 [Blastomyces dermatitidis ER-3]|uniref:Uncharacterized protein n=2 Tax=Ajellomyces dermatitidis TaxID=5039 RepID=F2T4V3_AJEDA|nr:uncharacterized protein BDCG_08393 [Blastomyces dermatitidis ER-3]EEQ85124.1 hypothetical protein BDCG_08393 [Blastomyces dermatitidis ER-3]EGE78178.1 hypothetical protein BDDG_01115 [Blastomyces dermatitidis ATCC 18188]EQL29433.1 hypothetical protein BDFG_07977 [Blastomyces dermatitidis ATCC 26199]